MFLRPFNSEFRYIKIQFIDPTFLPLETKDKINITLVIAGYVTYKLRYSAEHLLKIMDFCL